MPRIRCRYEDCVFLEEGYCGAAAIELEPDAGCLTYSRVDDADAEEPEWEEDEFDDEFEDEDEDLYDDEDDEDLWDDEDENEY
jgi:hypothetical protein